MAKCDDSEIIYLSCKEFGKKIGVSDQTVRRWAKLGYIKSVVFGRQTFIPSTETYPQKLGTPGKKFKACEHRGDGFLKSFGFNLAEEMKKKNITEIDLAVWVGVSPQMIYRYISGKSYPSLVVAYRLAYELDISLDELCGTKKRNGREEPRAEST